MPAAQWMAHNNAIFDVAWCAGDRQLVTASGDQKARLWDVEQQRHLQSLRGHSGSVFGLVGGLSYLQKRILDEELE